MTYHPGHHRPRPPSVAVLAVILLLLVALYVWTFARGRADAPRLRDISPPGAVP